MRASTPGQPTAVVLIPLHDFHDQNHETEGYTTGTPTTQTHWDHQYWYFQVTDFLLNSHLVPNAPHMSNIYVFMYGQKPAQQNPSPPGHALPTRLRPSLVFPPPVSTTTPCFHDNTPKIKARTQQPCVCVPPCFFPRPRLLTSMSTCCSYRVCWKSSVLDRAGQLFLRGGGLLCPLCVG